MEESHNPITSFSLGSVARAAAPWVSYNPAVVSGRYSKVKEALKHAKVCKKCKGLLEPKFGDYHPICDTKNVRQLSEVLDEHRDKNDLRR